MAYGGLASGLLGMVSGAGDQANQRIEMQNKTAAQKAMLDMEMEAKLNYEQRVTEMRRQADTKDLKAIESGARAKLDSAAMRGLGYVGQGVELTAEDAQALRDNPEAVAAYRNAGAKGLLNYDRQAEAEAKSSAALEVGRTDFADKYESVAKGERMDAKEERRHQETLQRMDIQLGQSASAARRAEASEGNAQLRAKMSALSTAGDGFAKEAKDIKDRLQSNEMLTDEQRLTLQEDLKNAQGKAAQYYAKSIELAGVDMPKTGGGGIDELFPRKPAAETAKPEATAKPAAKPTSQQVNLTGEQARTKARELISNLDTRDQMSKYNTRKALDALPQEFIGALRKEAGI